MAEVNLTIGGRGYRLACRDGEEADLRAAGGLLDSRVGSLMQAHGAIAEPRLLLMAALLLAGELLEERAQASRLSPQPENSVTTPAIDAALMEKLASRAETLARRLEEAAAAA